MSYDNQWNSRRFVGSGHAQSQLVNGQPLLSQRRVPAPARVGGPWRAERPLGALELWLRLEDQPFYELRWKAGGRSAQVPWAAICSVQKNLRLEAWSLEQRRLEALHGEEAFDDDGKYVERFTQLEVGREDALIPGRLESLADSGLSATLALGSWWLGNDDDRGPLMFWRSAWQKRVRCAPLTVVQWAVVEVPARMEQERGPEFARALRLTG
jgi:hypothetical protein